MRNFESSIDAVAGRGPHSARSSPSVLEINGQRCAKSAKYPLNAQSVAPCAGVVRRRNGTKVVKCPNFARIRAWPQPGSRDWRSPEIPQEMDTRPSDARLALTSRWPCVASRSISSRISRLSRPALAAVAIVFAQLIALSARKPVSKQYPGPHSPLHRGSGACDQHGERETHEDGGARAQSNRLRML